MRTTEFLALLEVDLPLDLAMDGDPVGVQVMAEDRELSRVGVAYEITGSVIEKAAAEGVELLIAFHPLIYPSLTQVTPSARVGQSVIDLIRKGITLHIVHTAFDAHPRGSNRLLAEGLGLQDITPLAPIDHIPGAGMGAVGNLPEAMTIASLASRLSELAGAKVIRISTPASDGETTRTVRRVAMIAGSGMSFFDRAIASGADAFITADVRYHGFHDANDSIVVLDPGHAESECMVVEGLSAIVQSTIKRNGLAIDLVPILVSTNPVHYYCV